MNYFDFVSKIQKLQIAGDREGAMTLFESYRKYRDIVSILELIQDCIFFDNFFHNIKEAIRKIDQELI